MNDLTLRNARRSGSAQPIDIGIRGGRIVDVSPHGTSSASGETIELGGRFIGPGLWDGHVHFTQHVTRRQRVDLTGTHSAEDVLRTVREAIAHDVPLIDGMLVGYGFRDGLWPEPASLAALEEIEQALPVVLISGDLHCAWMNTRAASRLGLALDETGVVAETAWIGALQTIDHDVSLPASAYRSAAEHAASRGVVGIVEYENADNIAEWPERVGSGVDLLRVRAAVWPDRLERAVADGHRTGELLDPTGLVEMGSLKVVVDGSLNTRTAWCWDPYPGVSADHPHACGVESVAVEALHDLMRSARDAGIDVAVHAIGDRANSSVLDAFAELGMRGVIEHAQLVREDDFARFAQLGLIASVQPEHAMDDRDVADRHWAGRAHRSFAFGSLHRTGAALRLGSDAPVAPLDPWIAIAAAVSRSRDGREAWFPAERIPIEVALSASTRTTIDAGQPADLVVTDLDPLTTSADALRAMPVAATLIGGRFTHRAL